MANTKLNPIVTESGRQVGTVEVNDAFEILEVVITLEGRSWVMTDMSNAEGENRVENKVLVLNR